MSPSYFWGSHRSPPGPGASLEKWSLAAGAIGTAAMSRAADRRRDSSGSCSVEHRRRRPLSCRTNWLLTARLPVSQTGTMSGTVSTVDLAWPKKNMINKDWEKWIDPRILKNPRRNQYQPTQYPEVCWEAQTSGDRNLSLDIGSSLKNGPSSRSLLVQRKIHRGKAIRGPCHVQFELLWSDHRVNLWKINGWRPRKWSLGYMFNQRMEWFTSYMQEFFHLMNGGQIFFWSSKMISPLTRFRFFPCFSRAFHPTFPNLEEKRRGVMLCLPLLQLRLRKAGDEIDGDAGMHTWSPYIL